jgi:hypothetical protein
MPVNFLRVVLFRRIFLSRLHVAHLTGTYGSFRRDQKMMLPFDKISSVLRFLGGMGFFVSDMIYQLDGTV